MERKKKRGAYVALSVLILAGLLLLIRSCAPQNIDSLLSENGIHPDQVMVVTPIDSRTHVVLYRNTTPDGVSSGLVEQELWSSRVTLPQDVLQDNPNEPISTHRSGYQMSDGKAFDVAYGYVHDPEITKLRLRYELNSSSEEVEADILEPSNMNQERLWYAIIQQPTTGIQLEIQGLDNGGRVIYSSQENED
ncbi:hypothetical protein ACINKY_11410 [Paenibacillus illinoisensis]|uniref:Uncharacterized protein n=1 Tax=Paenibacillus illinoisensis TaxID=59845 RepID=A0ABW8HTM3_9BACL